MDDIGDDLTGDGAQHGHGIADKQIGMNNKASEQTMLVDRKRRVSSKTAYYLRNITLGLSWVSVVYLGSMGIVTFVLAIMKKSSSAFAFSLDAMLDATSSVVVIWRYSGAATVLYSSKKERTACISLGVLFIISFASIVSRSSVSIAHQTHPKRSVALWVISIVNSFVCLGFLISKSILAQKLESISIATDAVNSGIGFIMAFSAVLSDWAYNHHGSVWYIDPVIGIICSAFLLFYGIWIIVFEVKCAKHVEGEVIEFAEE